MKLLEVEELQYAYRHGKNVLDSVSFAVNSGENTGLVGESGSGKTTILRLLLGLIHPGSGSISFNGELVKSANPTFMKDYRRSVQMVFQDPYSSLDPRQSVRQIITEPLRSLKIKGPWKQAVSEALKAVDLPDDTADRYPHEFSGGQRQRIAIARAIVAHPQLLLADEPVSALDLSTRIRIIDLLKSLSQNLTIVLVSHDLGVVASLCDKTIVLDKGIIVEQGNTREVLNSPNHPYTQRLLAAVPRLEERKTDLA